MKRNYDASTTPLQPAFKFDLAASKPTISEYGNTIREANQNDFPVLAGNAVSFFQIDMKPGALRGPSLASERVGAGLLRGGGSQVLDHRTGQPE
jgi:hypothetical protein